MRFKNGLAAGFLLAIMSQSPCLGASTQTYTYDTLGRLTSVASNADKVVTYAYDAAGNRTSVYGTTYLNESFAGKIFRLYDVALGRPPTSGEFGVWLKIFEGGASIDDAAAIFLADAGVQARWGGATSDTVFIANLYGFAFRRAPFADETALWVNALQTNVTTRAKMLAFFSEHPGHRQFTDGTMPSPLMVQTTDTAGRAAQIYRMYDLALGRAPLPGEIHVWLKLLNQGASLDTCAAGFLADGGVAARWGADPSDAAFVQNLYQFAFLRAASDTEMAYWLSQLSAAATTRPAMFVLFSEHSAHSARTDPAIVAGLTYDY